MEAATASPSVKVRLNKAACKALRREAKRDMQNSLQERALFTGKDERQEAVDEYTVQLLEAADLLGAIHNVRNEFKEGAALLWLTAPALTWIRRTHGACTDHLRTLDEGDEAPYGYNAREAYLVHVLGLVVAAADKADEHREVAA
jgi:hypothetical protein